MTITKALWHYHHSNIETAGFLSYVMFKNYYPYHKSSFLQNFALKNTLSILFIHCISRIKSPKNAKISYILYFLG